MNEEKLKKQPKRVFTRLSYPLPSYHLNFEKHFEIIKAFVELSKDGKRSVCWRDFKGLVSVDPHYVSANVKFFESIGLIRAAEKERGKYYPSEEAIKLSKAKVWNAEEAENILRQLIMNSWFWQSTKQLLNVRNGKCSKDDLIRKLGVDSGANKKHLSSLNILIEYLKYVELIKEENGTIQYGKFGQEATTPLEIKVPRDKDMIVIKLSDGLFAVDIKELESFVREKGRKLDEEVYKLKRVT
jgi:hypothetical protein